MQREREVERRTQGERKAESGARRGRDEEGREYGEGEREKKNASRTKEERKEGIKLMEKLVCQTDT